MPQTVWLSSGDPEIRPLNRKGLCKRRLHTEGKLGAGKGKLCPLRGCKDSPPEGLQECEENRLKWISLGITKDARQRSEGQ